MAVNQLVESLGELRNLYGQLYELGLRKKELLIKDQLDELTGIINKETRLLKQLAESDNARVRAIAALQREKGQRVNTQATLAQVSALLADPEERRALNEASQRLSETVAKLKELNALNQQLIQQSIDFIEYSLDLMVGPAEDEVVYRNPNVQPYAPRRTGGFDYKA